jgi:hypothetical protein
LLLSAFYTRSMGTPHAAEKLSRRFSAVNGCNAMRAHKLPPLLSESIEEEDR